MDECLVLLVSPEDLGTFSQPGPVHRKVTLTSRLSQQTQLHTCGLVSGLCSFWMVV